MPRLARQNLGERHALVLRLVGEHRPADRIADRIDSVNRGFEMRPNLDAALAVAGNADAFQSQTFRKRNTAHCDENHIGRNLFGSTSARRFHRQCDAALRFRRRRHL